MLIFYLSKHLWNYFLFFIIQLKEKQANADEEAAKRKEAFKAGKTHGVTYDKWLVIYLTKLLIFIDKWKRDVWI